MSEIIVVTGPPGSGKSSTARHLSTMFDRSALVAGDDFFGLLDHGFLEPWTAETHQQNETVTAAAAVATGRFVVGGYDVVYDGVVGPWFLDAFGRATGLARLHYVVLLPAESVCLERVRTRAGHGFTDLDAARHMYAEFAGAAVDERYFAPMDGQAHVTATMIHERVRAGLHQRTIHLPN